MDGCYSPLTLILSYLWPAKISDLCAAFLSVPVSPTSLSLAYYLKYFLLTLALESPFLRFQWKPVLLLNLATHPIVIWLFPRFLQGHLMREVVAWSECFAIVVECTLLYRVFHYSLRRAILIGTTANLFSWWVGLYL